MYSPTPYLLKYHLFKLSDWLMCVCVCVWERERERASACTLAQISFYYVLVLCLVLGYVLQFGEIAHKRVHYYNYYGVLVSVLPRYKIHSHRVFVSVFTSIQNSFWITMVYLYQFLPRYRIHSPQSLPHRKSSQHWTLDPLLSFCFSFSYHSACYLQMLSVSVFSFYFRKEWFVRHFKPSAML